MANVEAQGTAQDSDALAGTGLLQSPAEWNSRNTQLASSINGLIHRHIVRRVGRGLDVGCMQGELTDRYGAGLGLDWFGIDPDVAAATVSPGGAQLSMGAAHQIEFPAGYFDAVTLANVAEHIPPALLENSLQEIYRVLAPGGILVGQIPNPFFVIESHSRLPFFGFCPRSLRPLYWRLTPTGWDYEAAHFFNLTIGQLTRLAREAGFEVVLTRSFNYGLDAIPKAMHWAARLHGSIGGWPAWSWQFVYRRPAEASAAQ